MTDQPTTPPPGWYADPGGTAELRWWDGQAWTAHTNQADPAGANPNSTNPTPTSSTPPDAAATPGSEVPWWAQSGDGKPPSWWKDGNPDERRAWDASQAVGDRRGPADPSSFGVPGAVPESRAAPMAGPYANTRSVRPIARADGAVRALVLGLVSLVCCGLIIGPFAIYEGVQVRYRVRTSNGRLSGDGFGVAAIILGSVAVLLSLVGLYLAATGRYQTGTTRTRIGG